MWYNHEVVIHKNGLGTETHTTNHIGSLWNEIKVLVGYYVGLNGNIEHSQTVATYFFNLLFVILQSGKGV